MVLVQSQNESQAATSETNSKLFIGLEKFGTWDQMYLEILTRRKLHRENISTFLDRKYAGEFIFCSME